MIKFSISDNLANPFKSKFAYEAKAGITVREWLRGHFGDDFVEFPTPTMCIRLTTDPEKVCLMRSEWDTPLAEGEHISFVPCPQWMTVLYIVIMIAISVAVALAMRVNITPPVTSLDEGDSVFSLRGQRNQVRLGGPIEVIYGRPRIYPSYAASAYNQYYGNEQWLFQLFCVGQGRFLIDQLYIENTRIEEFQDVEYQIVQPGGFVTLFPDNVINSPLVSGIELFGPNEEQHGTAGPFVVTPPGQKCNRIECDFVFPTGLYYQNDNGELESRSINIISEAREIDDYGNPLGEWFNLFYFNSNMSTVTPQRFTQGADVPLGRYQVQTRRTNNKDTSIRAGNTAMWETLRCFQPSVKSYGDVTMLAVKARASNNLNTSSASRFNLVATRFLPLWDNNTKTWTDEQPTRNPIWAYCDAVRKKYGGGVEDAQFLDMDTLSLMAAKCEENQWWFDWVFDQTSTLWDTLMLICQSFRAVPWVNGSLFTVVRDEPQTLPSMIFNKDNVVANSWRWEIKPPAPLEYDGLLVSYIDEDTWREETVMCLMPDEEGNNPEPTRMDGVTNRTRAYRLGMYKRACFRYLRENIKFTTGMEGQLPAYGDVVSLAYDRPKWGQGGMVESIADDPSGKKLLTLNQPVTFLPTSETHYILLRKNNGSASKPMAATPGPVENQVLVTPTDWDDFIIDGVRESPMFQFGPGVQYGRRLKIRSYVQGSDNTVELVCSNVDDIVYSFDELTAPALGDVTGTLPQPAPVPVVTHVNVIGSPSMPNEVIASWQPVPGAQRYQVQLSYDGLSWTDIDTTESTSVTFTVLPKTITVRVRAINVGSGAWSYWGPRMAPVDNIDIVVGMGDPPGIITEGNVTVNAGMGSATIQWMFPPGAPISQTNIFWSDTDSRPPTPQATVLHPTNVFAILNLIGDKQYYIWLQLEGVSRPDTPLPIGVVAGPFTVTPMAIPLGVENLDYLPLSGNFEGRLIMLTADVGHPQSASGLPKLFRWTSNLTSGPLSNWTADVNIDDFSGLITETKIADGAITTPKIQTGAIVAGHIQANQIDSTKLNVAVLSAITADVGLLRTSTSGARLEISGTQIRIYDAAGTLRVELGILS